MKRNLLALATRPISRATTQPWICRRCLAQAAGTPSYSSEINPASFTTSQLQSKAFYAPIFPDTPTTLDAAQTIVDDVGRSEREELLDVLKTDLRHDIPSQYLVHIDPKYLTPKEIKQRRHLFMWAMPGHVSANGEPKRETSRQIKGVVVSAGKMDKTVKVRVPGQRWEPRIKKYFASPTNHLVHDPNNSLLEGDIVILHRFKATKNVEHVVGSVTVPYGKPLSERPPILTPEERLAIYKKQRLAKFERQDLRTQATKDNKRASTKEGKKQSKSSSADADAKRTAMANKSKHQQDVDREEATSNILESRAKTAELQSKDSEEVLPSAL